MTGQLSPYDCVHNHHPSVLGDPDPSVTKTRCSLHSTTLPLWGDGS